VRHRASFGEEIDKIFEVEIDKHWGEKIGRGRGSEMEKFVLRMRKR